MTSSSGRSLPDGNGQLPNFVIVGAARSGSTSLYRQLRSHPEVFLPRRKELHFFDKNWHRGLDWYRGHFSEVANETAVGEATPTYMYKAEAVRRMAATIPAARLVAILRNPVDRAYSHYWMNKSEWKEKLSFESALAAEPQRLAAAVSGGAVSGGNRSGAPGSCAYVDRGRYLRQLRLLCEHYPRHRLLVLLLEQDLRADPERAHSTLCQFLGVDPAFVAPDLGFAANRSRAYRSEFLGRMSRRLPPMFKPLTRPLARVNERPLTYPPMAPDLRARLLEMYEQDNADLEAWLGRDLSAWAR